MLRRVGHGRPSRAGLVLALLIFGLANPALAGRDADDIISEGYHHKRHKRPEQARSLVIPLLNADPNDVAAHRLYISTWATTAEYELVHTQYRAWQAEAPDNKVRRVVLAGMLSNGPRLGAVLCEEIEALLSPLPKPAELRYFALRALHTAHSQGGCDGDAEEARKGIVALRNKVSRARSWQIFQNSNAGTFDADQLAQLKLAYRKSPNVLKAAVKLWDEDVVEASDKAIIAARKTAHSAARKALSSKNPGHVDAARQLFAGAGDETWETKANARLQELDPNWQQGSSHYALSKEIREAGKRYSAEKALDALDALDAEIPTDGDLRGQYLRQRAAILTRLGRNSEVLDLYRQIHLNAPDAHHSANLFAWHAVLANRYLDEALTAVESAIEQISAERYLSSRVNRWQGGYSKWFDRRARSLSNYRDTRAWILYHLGRYQEAAAEQQQALLAQQEPTLHLHMGLIYFALGESEAALGHLAEGIRPEDTEDEELQKQARQAFDQLFARTSRWHPRGADGYLEDLYALREREKDKSKEDSNKETLDPRFATGASFPDLEYWLGEKQYKLSQLGGIVVVDLWATWCGPCVKGLPSLDKLARAYRDRGVTTIALSVDKEKERPDEFFKGEGEVGFLRGWAGAETLTSLGINSIPAYFVLDAELKIAGYFRGYQRGDRRIEKLLEELFANAQ